MPQSLAQVYVHLVFSTKGHKPVLEPAVREPLSAYLGGILRNIESPSLCIGCVCDHVHILYSQSRTWPLMDIVEEVKTSSSRWLKTMDADLKGFHWQNGYGAFSVSASKVEAVRRYIRRQEAHHRKMPFKDEFRMFLKEYGVEYDERYVWD